MGVSRRIAGAAAAAAIASGVPAPANASQPVARATASQAQPVVSGRRPANPTSVDWARAVALCTAGRVPASQLKIAFPYTDRRGGRTVAAFCAADAATANKIMRVPLSAQQVPLSSRNARTLAMWSAVASPRKEAVAYLDIPGQVVAPGTTQQPSRFAGIPGVKVSQAVTPEDKAFSYTNRPDINFGKAVSTVNEYSRIQGLKPNTDLPVTALVTDHDNAQLLTVGGRPFPAVLAGGGIDL